MRRGKWLFHHDQYKPQSPVFQVKGNPVRITASLEEGLGPQIQILLGDNPDDPSAVWVDWRKNGQELRLSAASATQTIIAAAGWYRLDTDDLAGTQSMVWVEDEEGSLDRIVKPMTMLRPACGDSTIQPPIVDPIDVTCKDLRALLQAGSLQADRWYRVSGVQPGQLDGQPFFVYLKALAPSQIQWAGWLECEPFTQNGRLWPCALGYSDSVPGELACWVEWVHDLRNRNWLRGLATISQWPFSNKAWAGNTVEASQVVFATPSARLNTDFVANEVFNSDIFIGDKVRCYRTLVRNSRVSLLPHADTSPLLRTNRFENGSEVDVRGRCIVYNTKVDSSRMVLGYGTPLAPSGVVSELSVTNVSVSENSILSVDGITYGVDRAGVSGLRVGGNSRCDLRQFTNHSGSTGVVINTSVLDNASISARFIGYIEDSTVKAGATLELDNPYAIQAGGVDGCQLRRLAVDTGARVTIRALVNTPYTPTILNTRVSSGGVVDVLNCWQLYCANAVITSGSRLRFVSVGGAFFPASFRDSTLADAADVNVDVTNWRTFFHMRRMNLSACTVRLTPNAFIIVTFDRCDFYGGEVVCGFGESEVDGVNLRDGRLTLWNGRLALRNGVISDSTVFTQSGNIVSGSSAIAESFSVQGGATLNLNNASGIARILSVESVHVESGARLDVTMQAGSGDGTLAASTFSAGATHFINFVGAAAKVVQGLYSHGPVSLASVWGASFTGTNARNF